MLITHILIAILSILSATYALIRPTKRLLIVNYALIALTFASGTYLIIALHAPLLRTCLSGIAYLCVVTAMLVGANYRLRKAEQITV